MRSHSAIHSVHRR
jgi:hypothetical protein